MGETVDEILSQAKSRLASTSFGAPPREAYLLLGDLLGLSEAQLIARGDSKVSKDLAEQFVSRLERRLQGEPTAYILQRREFFGRTFRVDRRVLIPRPETEHLVEAVLEEGLEPSSRILDIGTGSGCLAITLALEIPTAEVVATDLSIGALSLAARNVQEHSVGNRVQLIAGDLAQPTQLETFDLVMCNPPYVDPADLETLSPEVRDFEPHLALFAENRGLAIYQRLFQEARELALHARLMLEIGMGQLDEIRVAAQDSGFDVSKEISDYAGIPRTLVLQRQP